MLLSSSPTTNTTTASTTTLPFPNKQVREKCKLARENYLQCIDKQYGIDAPSLDPQHKCTSFYTLFEQHCPKSWVTHFLDKREAEIRNRKLGFPTS